MRAHDQSGPDEDVTVRHRLGDGVFAEDLERAVVRVVLEQPVGRLVAELRARALLVERAGEVRVDRGAGDEQVVVDGVRKSFGGGAHDVGDIAARIHDRIPGPAVEQGQVVFAIPADLLSVRKQLGVRLTAVEERDFVSARERRLGGRSTEELRAAEDEEPHDRNAIDCVRADL